MIWHNNNNNDNHSVNSGGNDIFASLTLSVLPPSFPTSSLHHHSLFYLDRFVRFLLILVLLWLLALYLPISPVNCSTTTTTANQTTSLVVVSAFASSSSLHSIYSLSQQRQRHHHSSSRPAGLHPQLAMMNDELPRDDIALLYHRLKSSGDVTTTGSSSIRARSGGKQRQRVSSGGKNARNRTSSTITTAAAQTKQQQQSTTKRKIVPPVVISAILSTSNGINRSSISNTAFATATSSPRLSDNNNNNMIWPSSKQSNRSSISALSVASGSSSRDDINRWPASSATWSPGLVQIGWVTGIVLIGLFFSLATTVGNALVMISICVDRKLQTISNYFLFSLAVADLTIGLISIPLMTLYTANDSWSFGYTLCQFWLCIDYLMCNASVLNLLLISFDRYFSVTRPLTYRPKRTTRKALCLIASTYIVSIILWPPWIVLWPYLEGRFIVEESSLCVVQFLAIGDARNWRNQLATVVTAAAAFYIPVTLMILLYYKVYLETQRRQLELRKLQDGQRLFSPSRLAGTSALHSLMLPLAPLIRGLQSTDHFPLSSSFPPSSPLARNISPVPHSPITSIAPGGTVPSGLLLKPSPSIGGSRINFMELVSNISSSMPNAPNFRKKERFSLLKFCTGKSATTDVSSEDSVDAGMDETCGLTTSNLDSILAENTAIELVQQNGDVIVETATAPPPGKRQTTTDGMESPDEAQAEGAEKEKAQQMLPNNNNATKQMSMPFSNNNNNLDLSRTSRPSSMHTYNSIVIIEYHESNNIKGQRPSVRLSCQAEVETLSARNSVERRLEPKKAGDRHAATNKEMTTDEAAATATEAATVVPRKKLRQTKSCPSGHSRSAVRSAAAAPQQQQPNQQQQQQNGTLMKKSEIAMLREEQMRRSEKERRRNERKQESKAAKTLSAILFAFIITWTPYNVIVCLEAFYPNSVPASLFTLSYFLSYVNSTINPLCYALCNARFRMTYMRILRCKWGRRNSAGFDGAFVHQTGSGRKVLLKGRHRATPTTTRQQPNNNK